MVVSPWYWPRKPITMGRPVARRIIFTAVSTASVPFSAGSTRVSDAGEISTSFSASGSIRSEAIAEPSSLPSRPIASVATSISSSRQAPSGTDAEAETRSAYSFPSRSVSVHPDLLRSTNGARPSPDPG